MQRYRNLSGNSGVAAYETGADFIRIQFADGGIYRYDNASTGPRNIEELKRLAARGQGLATFINVHVRDAYALKER
jgi:hypothetical protein